MKKLFLTLILISGLFLVSVYTTVQGPTNTLYPKQIQYNENEPLTSFIQRLEDEQIIKNKNLFKIIFVLQGADRSIKPGTYTFTKPLSMFGIIEKIGADSKTAKGIKIVIPEGSTTQDINQILNTGFQGKSVFAIDTSHEGYLFPDTYFFSAQSTQESIVQKLQSTWKSKTEYLFKNKTEQAIKDTIIMASILEKEGKTKEERYIISGVLWKRIREGIPLQVDATFLYTDNKGTAELTLADLETDSPYNTYRRKGLPIGPINNPGLETIEAALNPKESPYYFYLHDSNGVIHYAKTFEEHKQNKARYLR